MDFFKFNHKLSLNFNSEYYAYNSQMMVGVRGNSSSFAKCMSAYAAIRLGYGITYEFTDNNNSYFDDNNYYSYDGDYSGHGICGELEIGLNINRFFFIAYSYNYQGGKSQLK